MLSRGVFQFFQKNRFCGSPGCTVWVSRGSVRGLFAWKRQKASILTIGRGQHALAVLRITVPLDVPLLETFKKFFCHLSGSLLTKRVYKRNPREFAAVSWLYIVLKFDRGEPENKGTCHYARNVFCFPQSYHFISL